MIGTMKGSDMRDQNKILTLFKSPEDSDIILSRLHSINDILNECEEDEVLDIVQNKIIEAIDWYTRYCDEFGIQEMRSKPD